MDIGNIVWNGFAIIGVFIVICLAVVIGIALVEWLQVRRQQEEGICSCFEIPGDNPNCPLHAELYAQYDRHVRDPRAPTHFELHLKEAVKSWPVSGPCSGDNTANVHKFLRRRSKAN